MFARLQPLVMRMMTMMIVTTTISNNVSGHLVDHRAVHHESYPASPSSSSSLSSNGRSSVTIKGRITSVDDIPLNGSSRVGRIVANLYRNNIYGGIVQSLKYDDIYNDRLLVQQVVADSHGGYGFVVSASAYYSMFAFTDRNNNNQFDPHLFESCGWYRNGTWLMDAVMISLPVNDLDFTLNSIAPLPNVERRVDNGWYRQVKGHAVVTLSGTPRQRGYAHGKLLSSFILSFFRFYVLETTTDNRSQYENEIIPYVKSVWKYEASLMDEVGGILDGMTSSLASLYVPELDRALNQYDILYMNMYGSYPQVKTSNDNVNDNNHNDIIPTRACTQFILWGDRTRNDGIIKGGTITGRNMDGELDIRRITAANFVIFAIERYNKDKRFVHFMWPGFITVSSGINEDGMYTMTNSGRYNPSGAGAKNVTPDGWVQRQILTTASSLTDVNSVLDTYRDDIGGVCAPSCIFVMAQPSRDKLVKDAGMIYEGDRSHGVFRYAADADPFNRQTLMATNYFFNYGFDPASPQRNFGVPIDFSSLWRYEAGKNMLNSFEAINQSIGTSEMVTLLRTVSEAATEHSIIVRPDDLTFDVAVAGIRAGGWHAPYEPFATYSFHQLF